MSNPLFNSQLLTDAQPLAYRMRPRTLDEYIGQDHIIGHGRLLRRAIEADQLSSVIFYGPHGTGKTTLARVIANTTKNFFCTMNAVLSGVKELRDEIEQAKNRLSLYSKRTILFIDEVHRWNKSQQDALLPWVENGTFILIGATTENPFFEVNAALVSRSRIFQLKSLTDEDLKKIALQAVNDKERGYGFLDIEFEDGALEHLIDVASGDARSLLNAVELAVKTTEKQPNGKIYISRSTAEESIQKKAVLYDKEGDYHFDVISAFIKSLRGSDPDAALYWLAKMVHAGEDPRFIFRRMLISACEDIGLADPNAIVVVQSDAAAFEMVGMPEGRYHLIHAALYLSTAPKSNSAMGFFDALKSVEEESQNADVPNHLKDANRDSKGFGHGEGYMYPHSYREHWVAQQYLPNELQGKIFYQGGNLGYERKIAKLVSLRREIQLESIDLNAFPENLTYSPENPKQNSYLIRLSEIRSEALEKVRNSIFSKIKITRSDRILVLNACHGLLVWEAFRNAPEGLTVAQVKNNEDRAFISNNISFLKTEFNSNSSSVHCSSDRFTEVSSVDTPLIVNSLDEIENQIVFEHVIGRNVFANIINNPIESEKLIKKIKEKTKKGSSVVFSETIPGEGTKLSCFVTDLHLKEKLLQCEEKLYSDSERKNLLKILSRFFEIKETEDMKFTYKRTVTQSDLRRWIKNSYEPLLNLNNMDSENSESEEIIKKLTPILCSSEVNWNTSTVLINANC